MENSKDKTESAINTGKNSYGRIVLGRKEERTSSTSSNSEHSIDERLINVDKPINSDLTNIDEHINILHLSDLRWGWEDVDDLIGNKNIEIYKSLISVFENHRDSLSGWIPDMIILSGNITQQGKREEFEKCIEEFITPLMSFLHLNEERILVCPGNHDIDLTKAKKYPFPSPNVIDKAILDVTRESIDEDRKEHFKGYIESFCHGNPQDLCRVITIKKWPWFQLAVLNSAWDCRGMNLDRGRLRLGSDFIEEVIDDLKAHRAQYKKAAMIFNHPIGAVYSYSKEGDKKLFSEWFHCSESEKSDSHFTVKSAIIDNIDFNINGHLDYKENIEIEPIGKTVRFLSGLYSDQGDLRYLCRIIRIGKFSNTEYRTLTTSMLQHKKTGWKIGPPTCVKGEGDSPLRIFGKDLPLVEQAKTYALNGDIPEAANIIYRYVHNDSEHSSYLFIVGENRIAIIQNDRNDTTNILSSVQNSSNTVSNIDSNTNSNISQMDQDKDKERD